MNPGDGRSTSRQAILGSVTSAMNAPAVTAARKVRKAIVLEINEVPLRLFERFATMQPESAVASILSRGQAFRTHVNDVPEEFLYPAQTWASFNTGIAYERHRIHWYNDPKPPEYPFYWQDIASRGHSVGLVNTLHSSPLDRFVRTGNYQFVVPDCFAEDPATHPDRYRGFQALNLQLTRENGRSSELSSVLGAAAWRGLMSPASYGIRTQSAGEILRTVAGITTGRLNKERLRNLQFPLIAEIFLSELHRTDVNLGVLFTNHVAANQHRYWYALFLEDFGDQIYPDSWVERYRREIVDAMMLLDKYLKRLVNFCQETDRVLILSSSMGQRGNRQLQRDSVADTRFDFRLDDPARFVSALIGEVAPFRVDAGMVPQYSLVFEKASEARDAIDRLSASAELDSGIRLICDVNLGVLTLSANLDPSRDVFAVGGRQVGFRELGFVRLEIDDHHSGRHHPEGSLIVFNDQEGYFSSRFPDREIDYLEYAPALKGYFP
jgi:hypothetical protein